MIRGSVLLPCLLALACSACVELTEEIRFSADGSGTLSLSVTMDEGLAAMGEAGVDGPCPPFVELSEGMRILAREHDREDGRLHCRETVAFDSIELLNDPDDRFHHMELRVERGLFRESHHFTQVIAPEPKGLPALFLSDTHWRFRVRLPGTIVESNADHRDGGEAHWSLPLDRVLLEGATLEARSTRTRSASRLLALGAVAALAAGLLAWGSRRAPPESPPLSPQEDRP